ncbi:MAG TPA: DUF2231 domain-containing protein [Tepidisphaeraceae bacterium]|jgi:uncharacterized membrane protein
MHDEFIHPNWHVIFIHYPLALLSIGILIEIFSFLWRTSGFRAAGRWMILIGALATVPTITTGMYAYRDVVSPDEGGSWAQHVQDAKLNVRQWEFLRQHILYNAIGSAVFLVCVMTWLAGNDRWRRKLHIPLLALLVVGMGLLMAGAWNGGETVYLDGTGVTAASGEGAGGASNVNPSRPEAQAPTPPTLSDRIERYVPPIQLHMLSAGWVVALALVTLALSIRALTDTPESRLDHAGEPAPPDPRESRVSEQDERIVVALASPGVEISEWGPPRIPPARFWVVTAALGLLTAAGGLWVAGALNWPQIVHEFTQSDRCRFHIIFGVSIVVLTLVLAAVTRWYRRSKAALGIFSFLLLLAVAGQIWMGILLLFDGTRGSITRFRENTAATQPVARGSAATVLQMQAKAVVND